MPWEHKCLPKESLPRGSGYRLMRLKSAWRQQTCTGGISTGTCCRIKNCMRHSALKSIRSIQNIKRFHRVYQDLDKTDPIDAVVIADRVRFGKLNPNPLIDEQYEPLKRATRFRYHLVTQLIREENYFFNYLFLKFSSWQKLAPLSSPFGVTAEEIITEFDSRNCYFFLSRN